MATANPYVGAARAAVGQGLGHGADDLVACRMAMGVVHALEAVEGGFVWH